MHGNAICVVVLSFFPCESVINKLPFRKQVELRYLGQKTSAHDAGRGDDITVTKAYKNTGGVQHIYNRVK
jgi:hypothetical protein